MKTREHKPSCPFTPRDFRERAKPLPVMVGNQPLMADPDYKNLGWNAIGTVTVLVDGIPTRCNVAIAVAPIGRAELIREVG